MQTQNILDRTKTLRFRRGVIKLLAERLGINQATARARVHRRNIEALNLAHDIEQEMIAKERETAKKIRKNVVVVHSRT